MRTFTEIKAEWDEISKSRDRAILRGDAYGTDGTISCLIRDSEVSRSFIKEILATLAENEKPRTP